jgi:hypothetical protein
VIKSYCPSFSPDVSYGMRKSQIIGTMLFVMLPLLCQSQQVVINEFQKDPPSGGAEFIELLNSSDEAVDLSGWRIGDERQTIEISEQPLILPSGGFLVITDDSAGFIGQFGTTDFLEKRSLPALNNNGDQIRLFDADLRLVDSLAYGSDWGGKDLSLERRSPDPGLSSFKENWADSPSEKGGTPGLANEAMPDTTAPVLLSASFLGNSAVQLLFDEKLAGGQATDIELYQTSGAGDLLFIRLEENNLSLFFGRPFISGRQIEISIPPMSDIFGNSTEGQEITLQYVRLSEGMPDSVILNEILFLRADSESPEFVEIFNPSGLNYDLSDWSLRDAAGNQSNFPQNLILPAGDYLFFTDHEGFAALSEKGVYLSTFPSLNDDGEVIELLNAYDHVIDSLMYDTGLWQSTSEAVSKGISMERTDPRRSTTDPANWKPSRDEAGHTAGFQNSRFKPDRFPPRLLMAASNRSEDQLRLRFSEFIRMDATTEIYLQPGNQKLDTESATLQNASLLFDVSNLSAFRKVELRNVWDEVGNIKVLQSIAIAFPPATGDLVFTELLFDPISDAYDGFPDQSEYVEIYNRSDRSLSLEGLQLREAADEDGEYTWFSPENGRFKFIEPGEFYLIYADEEAHILHDSELGLFFGLPKSMNRMSSAVKRSSLSLSAEGDAVILTDSTGQVLDSLAFDKSWHNPNLFDHKGIALEKIRPGSNRHGPDEWSSSAHSLGGTPGRKNSISTMDELNCVDSCMGGNRLNLSPNPFSPSDMDGFEDHLLVQYQLDHPDYLIDVDIFDRYGRKVRQLAVNQSAGTQGTLIWDGFRDDGSPNRVGRYIILFKARNQQSGRQVDFKKTVVIAKR